MACVEDYIDALNWCEEVGGLKGLIARSQANLQVLDDFVTKNEWAGFLAKDPATRSSTSVCLTLDTTPEKIKKIVSLLEEEGAAFDIEATEMLLHPSVFG